MKDQTRAFMWVTKWGMKAVHREGRISDDGALFYPDGMFSFTYVKVGKEAFADEADARKDVRAKRIKRIESLKKQIAQLEAQMIKDAR